MMALSKEDLGESGIRDFLQHELGAKIEVYPLAGDASARKYFRVVRDQESFVLMQWESFASLTDYPFTNIGAHLSKHQVKVPRLIGSRPSEGLLLLEDLGDLTLERKFWESREAQASLGFYQQAIDQLIYIHYPATADRDPHCKAFQVQFDSEKFQWELNYSKKFLLEGIAGLSFSAAEEAKLQSQFREICDRLHEEDKFLCHRDYHSRNLMIKLGKIHVIDFQDARLGPIVYDLASLLRDSYVDIDSAMENQLLQYYLERRKDFITKPLSQDAFQEIYLLQCIQRGFKACGSFASFYQTRGDTRYLKYLPDSIERVITALEEFPEFQFFRDILLRHEVRERDYLNL